MSHVLPVLCIGHSHACPSMVAVMIGLNTQVGLVLTINCYLHHMHFDRPPASYGTKVVLFCDHLQPKPKPTPLPSLHGKYYSEPARGI